MITNHISQISLVDQITSAPSTGLHSPVLSMADHGGHRPGCRGRKDL